MNPDKLPTTKVTAASLAGALSIVLTFILAAVGVNVTPELASAFTVVLTVAAGYLTPERSQ